jgi:glycerophosphoryl diester phosphodiesterase
MSASLPGFCGSSPGCFAASRSHALASLFIALAALVLLAVLRSLTRAAARAAHLELPVPKASFCAAPAPMLCAHGGVTTSGELANTAPAYTAALSHPSVRCVEVDVSRTRDETLVALHTRQLLRISDGDFVDVGAARLEELLAYGERKGEAATVLTVSQALGKLVGQGLEAIILDIKDGPPLGSVGMAALALAAARAARCAECVLWSKDDSVVRELLAALSPMRQGKGTRRVLRARGNGTRGGGGGGGGGRGGATRGLLQESGQGRNSTQAVSRPLPSAMRAGFVLMNDSVAARQAGMHRLGGRLPGTAVVAAHWAIADEALVAAARRRGLAVFGWTANEPHMADALLRAGVAAIITDEPDMVAERAAALRDAECS